MKHLLTLALACLLVLGSAGCRAVTGGNYVLRSGETLSGDLTVSGGHATLEQGSRVTGSLFVTGGSTEANGQIDGDVSVTGGSINFGPTSVVRGVLHETGGGIRIAQGADVRYGQPSPFGSSARPAGTLATVLFMGLLALAVALVFLLMTRTTRGAPSQPTFGGGAAGTGPTPSPSGLSPSLQKGQGQAGSMVLAIVLIVLGVMFLLQELLNVDVWHYAWPLFVVVAGLLCFAAMVLRGKGAGWLAIPGSLLAILGLVLLFQNAFDRFESWAYAWALIFPTSVGIGHFIEGRWDDRPALRERGIRETRVGLIVFVVLAVFFELVINLGGYFREDLGRYLFPILLIILGIALIFGVFFNRPSARPAMQTPAGTGIAASPASPESDRQKPVQQ